MMSPSRTTRAMAGLTLIIIPTVEFGGYFLLSQFGRTIPVYGNNQIARDFMNAGHAHAGVLLVLGLIGQVLTDYARLPRMLAWAVRVGLIAAPVLISGGFFGAAPPEPDAAPSPLVVLIYSGMVTLGLTVLTLGIGLLRSAASSPASVGEARPGRV